MHTDIRPPACCPAPAGTVAAFLHENLPNFVADSAAADMASCLSYLSAADCIASSTRWGGGEGMLVEDDMPTSTLADAVAASTAARGVCFGNCHPAPRRWLPLKAPALFMAQKAAAANRQQLQRAVAPSWALHGGAGGLEPGSQLATELLPYARSIQASAGDSRLQVLLPARWVRVWAGQVHQQGPAGAAAPAVLREEVLDSEAQQQQRQQQGSEDAIETDSGDEEDW